MKYLIEEDNSPTWKIVSDLFALNYTEATDTEQHIPKIIHQIWLGGNVPEKYEKFMQSWKFYNPDYKYKLWTDKDVNDIFITKRSILEACPNQGMKSDLLRYEILKQYGGVYIDVDFECIRPLDDLLNLKFFCGLGYGDVFVLYIGIIASIPNHPIIQTCIDDLDTPYRGHDAMEIMHGSGPYHFTKCFLKTIDTDTSGVVVFPFDFFYCLPNTQRAISNPKRYIKECSYGIHYWTVSWQDNK
jgi:mannosyltransferase OCH1-like enzyme